MVKMPLSTIIHLYCGGQFYWWRQPEYSEKNLLPAASYQQTLSHIKLHQVHFAMSGIQTHNSSGSRH
jgi:hypothetical protein